jgi:hypothetical protein
MDPYLEGSLWMSVHTQLSVEIARQLIPRLRPRYVALTPERFVFDVFEEVAVTTRTTIPDVGVVDTGRGAGPSPGAAVITAPALHLETEVPIAVPHVTVEIRDTANRQLVTAIEVLSPTNKRGEGRTEYLAKRRRLLLSTAHLMEIDLVREGHRVPMRQPLPSVPYFVFLSRAERRPLTDIWPIPFDQPLPVVPVPLLEGDPDVALDLQQALTNVYDLFGYELLIDYTRPPEMAMPLEAAAWAEEVLRPRRTPS